MGETKQLTCISCPIGCQLRVELDGKEIANVSGNQCKRGEVYARDEAVSPKRMLTSTVLARIGGTERYVPVKLSAPILKELIVDAMNQINRVIITKPTKLGSVVIKNLLGTGADVITTDELV